MRLKKFRTLKKKSQEYFKREENVMSEVSKFIPMEENGVDVTSNAAAGAGNSAFKVCGTSKNLPAKPNSFWSKLKGIFTNVLLSEIKVELTPYQQKIEDEINEFLHQEITWQSFKNFLFQDVEITTGRSKAK